MSRQRIRIGTIKGHEGFGIVRFPLKSQEIAALLKGLLSREGSHGGDFEPAQVSQVSGKLDDNPQVRFPFNSQESVALLEEVEGHLSKENGLPNARAALVFWKEIAANLPNPLGLELTEYAKCCQDQLESIIKNWHLANNDVKASIQDLVNMCNSFSRKSEIIELSSDDEEQAQLSEGAQSGPNVVGPRQIENAMINVMGAWMGVNGAEGSCRDISGPGLSGVPVMKNKDARIGQDIFVSGPLKGQPRSVLSSYKKKKMATKKGTRKNQ